MFNPVLMWWLPSLLLCLSIPYAMTLLGNHIVICFCPPKHICFQFTIDLFLIKCSWEAWECGATGGRTHVCTVSSSLWSTLYGNGDWVETDSIRASFLSELDSEMRWLVKLELCSCGSCSFCSCLARKQTRVDLIRSFLPSGRFLVRKCWHLFLYGIKLLPYNKWVKKRRIHTCMKITDCHMNWEMKKLCWQIDEKREEMASSGTIS
jgi:hypothetical protein